MTQRQINLSIGDGRCPAHVFTPSEGEGPWPGGIFLMDGLAIRPTLFAMAQRLADAGYVVILPDLFWRYGPYAPLDVKAALADFRGVIGPLASTTDNRTAAADVGACIAWLDDAPEVAGERYGVVGYCMGGAVALTVAGVWTDRIAAAASFHGGQLASDDEKSPHRLAPTIAAEVYIGMADEDPSYRPEMAGRLKAALDEAGVTYRHELYPGARHGWTMVDLPVFDEAAAERHWQALTGLFERTLGSTSAA